MSRRLCGVSANSAFPMNAMMSGIALADNQFGHILNRYFDIAIARKDRPALRRYYDALTMRAAFREHVMISYEELRVRD